MARSEGVAEAEEKDQALLPISLVALGLYWAPLALKTTLCSEGQRGRYHEPEPGPGEWWEIS